MERISHPTKSRTLRTLGLGLVLGALAACGGGGAPAPAANSATGQQPAAPTTGSIGIVLRDGPTDEFCQILARVQRIDLLGDAGPTNLWSGDVEIDGPVPAGAVACVRATLLGARFPAFEGAAVAGRLPFSYHRDPPVVVELPGGR